MRDRNVRTSDNWETPPEFYEALNAEFNFDFDPCPLNSDHLISADKNGLLIDWGKRNYVNPPYSKKLKEQFVMRAIDESKKGKLCVMLIPVSTSTKLFHDHIQPNAKEIRFVRGRIKFKGVEHGKKTGASMHDSMIVIFDGRKMPPNNCG